MVATVEVDPQKIPERPKGFGVRHIQTALMFTGLTFSYFLRVNVSSAIVLMMQKSDHDEIPYYNWSSTTKSLVLSSFFWGYVLAQIPSGLLAQKFGPKVVLATSTLICGLLTIAIPFGVELGDYVFLCVLRAMIGYCQGSVYPCVHTLLSKWAPQTERGFLSTFIYSGAQIGTVIMLGVSGIISKTSIGWPGIFYFSGSAGALWAIFYFFFGADSPSEVKKITAKEKAYIESLTGNSQPKNFNTPWMSICTSVPFIALLFAHCGFNWGFYTLLTEIPSFMDGSLGLDIQNSSGLSSLPYLTMWGLSLVFSPIADFLINRRITSVTTSRKIFNTIGSWIPACALLGLAFTTAETSQIAIVLLVIAVGFNSASYLGYLVNHMDLSPNYAGTMMGITNGISNMLSIFAPLIVGGIVTDETDASQWRIIFFITSATYFVCNLIFIIFGSGKTQKWNDIYKLSTDNNPEISKQNFSNGV